MKSIVPSIATLFSPAEQERAPTNRAWLGDLWRLAAIVMLAFAVRFWVLQHTEVLSRDSIGFIRFALQLEAPPKGSSILQVIRSNTQPPGYPAALLLVSQPVRSYVGATTCDSMVLSAQLTSVLASLLLVFPMYFIGKRLFDRQIAFIAALLYQLLPVCTQVTSDGLSDGLFLLMMMMALWFGVIALRRGAPGWFAGAGLFAGLAYLVRPEGLIVALALGVIIIALRLRSEWTWRATVIRGCALASGLLLVMTPYVATIGKLTNKPTGMGLTEGELRPSWERPQTQRGVNVPLAEWWNPETSGVTSREIWGAKALAIELVKASFYVLPLFAIGGLFILRSRIRRDAAIVLLVLVASLHLVLLWIVASRAGYVAERHTLLVVLIGSYFTAAAIPVLGTKLAATPRLARIGGPALWTAMIVGALAATEVPGGMKTLHANRAGHHAAGLWIAQHREPNDTVVDPFAWAEFYAGNVRSACENGPRARIVFIVLEGTVGNPHPRLHQMPHALKLAEWGTIVYHWPPNVPVERGKVFIYRLDWGTAPNPARGEIKGF